MRFFKFLMFLIPSIIITLYCISVYYPILLYVFKAKSIFSDGTEYQLPKYYFVMSVEQDMHTLASIKDSFSDEPQLFFVQKMAVSSSELEKRGVEFYKINVEGYQVNALFGYKDDLKRSTWFVADTYFINTYDIQDSEFPVELMHFYNKYYNISNLTNKRKKPRPPGQTALK